MPANSAPLPLGVSKRVPPPVSHAPPARKRTVEVAVVAGLACALGLAWWQPWRATPAFGGDVRGVAARDAGAPRDVAPSLTTCPEGMALLRGGSFQMGSAAAAGNADERPQHTVTLRPFCMDRTEVTVAAYRACAATGQCEHAPTTVSWSGISSADARLYSRFCNGERGDRANYPVNCVHWGQAAAYCRWKGGRLPIEAEWEFAARGIEGREYPWGNAAPTQGRANLCGSECSQAWSTRQVTFLAVPDWRDPWPDTAPVGAFPAGDTPEGIHDLAGNVWEWVDDVYAADAYRHHTAEGTYAREASDASQSTESRASRGASWGDFDPAYARGARRYAGASTFRDSNVGFRCSLGSTQ